MSLLRLLAEIAVLVIGTLHSVTSQKTYDLLRYSDIEVYKTTSKQENTACQRLGLLYDCISSRDEDSKLKTNIMNGEKSLNVLFDEHTKEVRFDVNFRKTYVINSLLLSFKEANNMSAISVEVWAKSKLVDTLQYAISQMVCDFFFADEFSTSSVVGCRIKSDLSHGIMGYFNPQVTGDEIVVRLFPPIVNDYDVPRFYSVNHLFIGGCCRCKKLTSPTCRVSKEDDVRLNDGKREVLVCDVDRKQLTDQKSSVVRRRRSLSDFDDDLMGNDGDGDCTCSKHGTLYGLCKPFIGITQQCPCKTNYVGISCDRCADGYTNYPTCLPCGCNSIGSMSTTCDIATGKCKCEPRYSGLKCKRCAPGRYNFPFCYPCQCARDRTVPSMCHPETGVCMCLQRYVGDRCNRCRKPLQNFPICHRPGCKCSHAGSIDGTCDNRGNCKCRPHFTGKSCDKCTPGFGNYPSCTACQCDPYGSTGEQCDPETGQCTCKPNFTGFQCNECTRSYMTYPRCDVKCRCHKVGSRQSLQSDGSCVHGHACVCKKNVMGRLCDRCKLNSYNMSPSNQHGCQHCRCSDMGSFGNLATCDSVSGQCVCKPYVVGRKCDRCAEGYYGMDRYNAFGCSPCNCDVGGSTGPNCDRHGNCNCKSNFHGQTCNQLKKGPYFVPSYYHIRFEAEEAKMGDKQVAFKYEEIEFPGFTGRGYISFGLKENIVKLKVHVPKTRKYKILTRYFRLKNEEISMLVNLQSADKMTSYAGIVDVIQTYLPDTSPRYAFVVRSDGGAEFFLTEGAWEMEMSSISDILLVDHVVMVPWDYYTGSGLEPDDVTPCVATQQPGSVCAMYKHVSLRNFQLIEAETGTDSKGYGDDMVRQTNIYTNPDVLPYLQTSYRMAELNRQQIALTLHISVEATDTYYLVISYLNPDRRTYRLDMYDADSGSRGQIEVVPCLYQFLCRLVVHRIDGTPLPFTYFKNKTSEITFLGNIRGSLAIDYVALIPVSTWSADYIIPSKLCYKRDKVCLQNIGFAQPHGVVDVKPSDANPISSLTNTVHAIADGAVIFVAKPLVKVGIYSLVYQFYQPNDPSFHIEVNLSVKGEIITTKVVNVPHCAANSGCRKKLLDLNAVTGIFGSSVTVSIKVPKGKELWIDSMFFVPLSSYSPNILAPKRTETTQQFKRACVTATGLPLLKPPTDFCMKSLVTLTSMFTNTTFQCKCNPRGSTSLTCDRIGGQCPCRPGVIGRDCSKCKTGDYNFPKCKTCSCFEPGSLSADCNKYGQCVCKPNYTGTRCDRCSKKRWGFPNCRECNCEARGSFSLTCRSKDGQCPCLKNFRGKTCNQCQLGFYDFPECRSCNCNPAGILVTPDAPTGCYKEDRNRCDCKLNVEGKECGTCKSYYYGLNISNPVGCTRCNCSDFGTVRGAGPCHSETGQCQCHSNVEGINCDTCKDGFHVGKSSYLFMCEPCRCSPGGSVNNICNKNTGQCLCKSNVVGLKCDQVRPGYHIPSIAEYSFDGTSISPSSPVGTVDGLEGTFVNSSYASMRKTFTIGDTHQYYLLISYALLKKKQALIDIEFTNDVSFTYLTQKLKTKRPGKAVTEIVKRSNSYLVLNFTRGIWHMQALFQETIFLNKITLVPAKYLQTHSISRTVENPCTIEDVRKFCVMYSYYDLTAAKSTIIEAESLSRSNPKFFDLNKHTSADINGALLLRSNEYLITMRNPASYQRFFFIVIQYLNTESVTLTLDITLRSNGNRTTERGSMKLFPCTYAFTCREVAISSKLGTKLFYNQGGGGDTYMTIRALGGISAYIDYIALVPVDKWTPNMLSPTFFCIRRFSRCMLREFPTTKTMLSLPAKEARGVSLLNGSPPNSISHSKSVFVTRYQKKLRWMVPIKPSGYYVIVHYHQPLVETFYAKLILTTYNRANAGKVKFSYCPSVYGCRSVVQYLDEDLEQRFALSGNIVGAIFTIPYHVTFWVESVIFVNPDEYKSLSNKILKINPIDQTKRFLKKCVGKKLSQLGKNVHFCTSSSFELTLGLGLRPSPCTCHPHGTVKGLAGRCDRYDGTCTCRAGFKGADCARCSEGTFPLCKTKSIIT